MPTALELTRDGWAPYQAAARRRSEPREMNSAERRGRQQLLGRARRAADLLKAQFGVRQVVLLGSLAHGAWFDSLSDVDLAVEGLGSSDYWRAWRVVEEVIVDREVDLIEIETASDALKQAIRRYGVVL